MNGFTRRSLLSFAASLPLALALPLLLKSASAADATLQTTYSVTKSNLTQAFHSEMNAHVHYLAFVQKALSEKFPNIAYLFLAFSVSEKIHADNYQRVLRTLDTNIMKKTSSRGLLTLRQTWQLLRRRRWKRLSSFTLICL